MSDKTEKEKRVLKLQDEIKGNNKIIKQRTTLLKTSLKKLQECIAEQALMMDLLKQEKRTHFTKDLSQVLNTNSKKASELYKSYKFVTGREKIDKIFLEYTNVLEKSERKVAEKVIQSKSALMVVGNLVGNVRSMQESKRINAGEKDIIIQMLEQLKNDL